MQLPPRWKRDTDRLAAFFETARSLEPVRSLEPPRSLEAGTAFEAGRSGDPGPATLRWAVEFRDPSWLHEDTYQLLRKYNVALCVHDLLPDHPWLLTANWAYCRFHGPKALTQKYTGDYGARRLTKPAGTLAQWRDEGCDVYAYFNNDEGGAAVRDAAWLKERLGS